MLTSGGVLVPRLACAADLITGAIPLNPTAASVAAQDKLIQQLKAAGVHVIRVALTPDYVRIDFAKRANAQGIKIEALIEPQVPKGASSAPDPSGGAPRTWGGLVLDAIDPLVVGRTLLIMVPLPAAACPGDSADRSAARSVALAPRQAARLTGGQAPAVERAWADHRGSARATCEVRPWYRGLKWRVRDDRQGHLEHKWDRRLRWWRGICVVR